MQRVLVLILGILAFCTGERPPGAIRIEPLDSGESAHPAERIRYIPLPNRTRLKDNLLHPDSLKVRITLEGTFRVEKGDLQPDTGAKAWVAPDKSKASRDFRTFWKQVEAAEGYPEFRRQMESAYRIEKSWVPKVLLFDSVIVVIPGYIFIRFRPRKL